MTSWRPSLVCVRCTRIGSRRDFACPLQDCPPALIMVKSRVAYTALCNGVTAPEPEGKPKRKARQPGAGLRALRALRRARRPLSTAEVRKRAGLCNIDAAGSCLGRLRRRGLVERVGRVWALR
jgi:hypothetical protein